MELPVDVIQRASHRLIADRRPHRLAADRALQAKARHQPLDGAAGNREAFSPQLPPDLPHAVDAEVLREHPLNLDLQFGVPLRTGRTLAGVDPLGDMRMVRRRGDRQHLADRLDPIRFPMIIDERDHGFTRRSSSAWAKYADALRRISFACRSSRFSRSKAFSFSAISVGTPARLPLSTSAFFTHSRSVCAVQPILAETETIVAPSRWMLMFVVQDQPHSARTDLRRKLVACLLAHGSTFSRVGASDQPGAVQVVRTSASIKLLAY